MNSEVPSHRAPPEKARSQAPRVVHVHEETAAPVRVAVTLAWVVNDRDDCFVVSVPAVGIEPTLRGSEPRILPLEEAGVRAVRIELTRTG